MNSFELLGMHNLLGKWHSNAYNFNKITYNHRQVLFVFVLSSIIGIIVKGFVCLHNWLGRGGVLYYS